MSDQSRYNRQLILRQWGSLAQEKLGAATVLVIGAGGLGCPVLQGLTMAGVGKIIVADHDLINESNLPRQGLYHEGDVGKPKAHVAVLRCHELNSQTIAVPVPQGFHFGNRFECVQEATVVVDCSDNFSTKYLVNETCLELDKPLVYGSVLEFGGHVGVFNLPLPAGRSAHLRDWFPQPPQAEVSPDCATAGVLGLTTALVGQLQAMEALKIITGFAPPNFNQLLLVQSEGPAIQKIQYNHPCSQVTRFTEQEFFAFCHQNKLEPPHPTKSTAMKEITVQELKAMKDAGEDFQLIDVREPHEYDICEIGGELIPQGQIPFETERIATDKKVIIHCRSGARSGNMVQWLEQNKGFNNLYNLKGGILAWAREIDPSMPTY